MLIIDRALFLVCFVSSVVVFLVFCLFLVFVRLFFALHGDSSMDYVSIQIQISFVCTLSS